jgi:hypothetical protein
LHLRNTMVRRFAFQIVTTAPTQRRDCSVILSACPKHHFLFSVSPLSSDLRQMDAKPFPPNSLKRWTRKQ